MLPNSPRLQSVSSHRRIELSDGWELCSTAPGAVADPTGLDSLSATWMPAAVPGTVADTLRRTEMFDLERTPTIDDRDWWYRCRFAAEPNAVSGAWVLRFDGLATLADVWLNGVLVLASENMFVAHEVELSPALRDENTLAIRFRSLNAALAARRPRPRWRTKLVEHQQLRWMRTTLLGRMPGWSPPVRPVGPWRAVSLEYRATIAVEQGDISPSIDSDGTGVARTDLLVRGIGGATVHGATLTVGGNSYPLDLAVDGERVHIEGETRLADVRAWWPHTHGEQPRYSAQVILATDRGDVTVDFGHIAFRTIRVATDDGQFTVHVNGTPIFCRGACWTTPDIVTLTASTDRYESLLATARDAGMNMLRVGGTMTYESDAFYDCCDRLGILVWQDFMFANMDYPADDAAFRQSISTEAASNIARLRRHPSLAVLCGNSEVEQQAAMLAVPREHWGSQLYRDLLPRLCAEHAPNVPYWPASPGGGALPFHADTGVAHYYGIGAYLRPLDDARRSNVRFAAECLGFANVPDQTTIDALLPTGESPVHHPRWKARVPRDHGAGWDFEDVRDHYLEALFDVHPMRLRYADMQRYLALSRVVTGEIMARTIGEWRRGESSCAGALIWVFQDLWPGAGWGVLNAAGRPKAAYYAIKRAMQPVALAITDEGVNGLHVHIANDRAGDLAGELRIALFRDGRACVASGSLPVTAAGRGTELVSADAVVGRFQDLSYAYRFGPAGHDLVVASLHDDTGARISDAFHFPLGLSSAQRDSIGLSADAERQSDGSVTVTVRTEQFAQFVELDCGDALPDDNYFHVAPGQERVVVVRPRSGGVVTEGLLQPLNAHTAVRFPVPLAARVPT